MVDSLPGTPILPWLCTPYTALEFLERTNWKWLSEYSSEVVSWLYMSTAHIVPFQLVQYGLLAQIANFSALCTPLCVQQFMGGNVAQELCSEFGVNN